MPRWSLINDDMLVALKKIAEAKGPIFDSVVTDPPYHLTSVVKRFGGANAAPAKHGTDGVFSRASAGFMGQQWDGGDIAYRPETWRAVYDVMKPGAFLVAFGGTRTYHRIACGIEDAGFEIRDSLHWLYGTGFPKSHNLALAIDKSLGHGNRGHRIAVANRHHPDGTLEPNGESLPPYVSISYEAKPWEGWGTGLKPAFEPVILARKPLDGTNAENALKHGTGGLNTDACRIATDSPGLGRFPANILHDGSPEVLAAFGKFGERPGQQGPSSTDPDSPSTRNVYGKRDQVEVAQQPRGDTGTAARFFAEVGFDADELRFFYSGKATKDDRAGSKHPTVKPIALMRWLCRLITPPNGLVLDPFAGSGSTGEAALREGFRVLMVEREKTYAEDIRNRMATRFAT